MGATSSTRRGEEVTCRYCRETEPRSELISPCKCSGSVKFIHKACLARWDQMRFFNTHCELCKAPYSRAALRHVRALQRNQSRVLRPKKKKTRLRRLRLACFCGSDNIADSSDAARRSATDATLIAAAEAGGATLARSERQRRIDDFATTQYTSDTESDAEDVPTGIHGFSGTGMAPEDVSWSELAASFPQDRPRWVDELDDGTNAAPLLHCQVIAASRDCADAVTALLYGEDGLSSSSDEDEDEVEDKDDVEDEDEVLDLPDIETHVQGEDLDRSGDGADGVTDEVAGDGAVAGTIDADDDDDDDDDDVDEAVATCSSNASFTDEDAVYDNAACVLVRGVPLMRFGTGHLPYPRADLLIQLETKRAAAHADVVLVVQPRDAAADALICIDDQVRQFNAKATVIETRAAAGREFLDVVGERSIASRTALLDRLAEAAVLGRHRAHIAHTLGEQLVAQHSGHEGAAIAAEAAAVPAAAMVACHDEMRVTTSTTHTPAPALSALARAITQIGPSLSPLPATPKPTGDEAGSPGDANRVASPAPEAVRHPSLAA